MRDMPADRCRVANGFWRVVEHLGVPSAALLRQARLPATLPRSEQQLVTTAQFFSMWRALEELSGDPAIGIKFVQASDAAGHQPLFLAACYAKTFRDGIARLTQFKRLASPEQFLERDVAQGVSVSRQWFYAVEPEPAVLVDVSFALLIALGRRATGQHITPVRIDYARSGAMTELHRSYFGCPINLEAQGNELVLRSTDLDTPFASHNSEFLDILTPAVTSALRDFGPESSITEQVKKVLKRGFAGGRPNLREVARALGASERTLQRRITLAGTTFRALTVEARQELCRPLLADASLEIDVVASLLGYHDASSFCRAFRAWEGITPVHWRAKHRPPLVGGRATHHFQ